MISLQRHLHAYNCNVVPGNCIKTRVVVLFKRKQQQHLVLSIEHYGNK
jgi:hypothetical protein